MRQKSVEKVSAQFFKKVGKRPKKWAKMRKIEKFEGNFEGNFGQKWSIFGFCPLFAQFF